MRIAAISRCEPPAPTGSAVRISALTFSCRRESGHPIRPFFGFLTGCQYFSGSVGIGLNFAPQEADGDELLLISTLGMRTSPAAMPDSNVSDVLKNLRYLRFCVNQEKLAGDALLDAVLAKRQHGASIPRTTEVPGEWSLVTEAWNRRQMFALSPAKRGKADKAGVRRSTRALNAISNPSRAFGRQIPAHVACKLGPTRANTCPFASLYGPGSMLGVCI
jgi:hypothetical protein